MAYLIAKDLSKQIQSENLNAIIGGDTSIITGAELAAMAEAQSYLTQRYDISREFADLLQWDRTQIYKAINRVYLNANAYSASNTYAVNSLVLQAGSVYKCTTAITVAEAFNVAKWALLGLQYDLYFAKTPYPEFDYSNLYNVGDRVFWNNKTYTCLIATKIMGQSSAIQYNKTQNLPYPNVAPDDVSLGAQYWGTGTAYTVPAATDISNTTYWTAGDNRSQQLVLYIIDIALYHVHSRISPRNIPDLRVKRYDDAIKWLKMAAKGDITPNLPMIKPEQGQRIRFGGGIKLINSY